MVACADTSWFTARLLNSLIIEKDANGQAVEYNMMASDADTSYIYWGGKCSQIDLEWLADLRILRVIMDFMFRGGDSEHPEGVVLPTFTLPTAHDKGELINMGAVTFLDTATVVQSWKLTLRRENAWGYNSNSKSVFPGGVVTGRLGGQFSMSQPPTRTAPETGAVIEIGAPGTGVEILLALSENNTARAMEDNETTTWKLFNMETGGSPITISDL
jgi:hypothetical protein